MGGPPACSFLGFSAMTTSVVINSEATLAAF
jgi:hypothetical protein